MALSALSSFAASESGAISVDWVVLTAGMIALGMAAMTVLSGGVEDLSGDIAADLSNAVPMSTPFANANQRAADGIN